VFEIGELPDPHPARGEVRVRILASGVNPTDTYTRSGVRRRGMPFETIVPNQDGAGVIDEVGEGVARERIGERVYVTMAQWQRPWGTASEYVALPGDRAIPLSENTGFEQGACLGVPILTAHYALAIYGRRGATVLVQGGAGAVGFYAIQFAKFAGASVIATVSSDRKALIARSAGADHVINYRSEDLGARVAEITSGRGVGRVLEVNFAVNAAKWPQVLGKGGTVIYGSSAGGHGGDWGIQNQPTIRFIYVRAAGRAYRRIRGSRRLDKHGETEAPARENFPAGGDWRRAEMVELGTDGMRAR
jgi:NADPH2:quinone reductase